MAGKFGRLPGQVPVGLRDLTYYAAGALPAAPASVPVPVLDWGMLGNDQYGDCGPAGLDHGMMAAASDTSEHEAFPDDQQVIDYYLAYTGGQDNGVVLSDYLAYVRRDGFYGHTVAGYAPVTVHDVPTLQFATWAYDFAYLGINVTQAMMDAFDAGQPWTQETAQGEVLGGHCIPAVGYDSNFLYVVTWGKVQSVAWPAWHAIAEEAWAVITGEDVTAQADGHGLNLAALQADLSQLAKPVPAPQPPAPPQPDPLLAELVQMIRNDFFSVRDWLEQHGL